MAKKNIIKVEKNEWYQYGSSITEPHFIYSINVF